jgi:hypothetical protein
MCRALQYIELMFTVSKLRVNYLPLNYTLTYLSTVLSYIEFNLKIPRVNHAFQICRYPISIWV